MCDSCANNDGSCLKPTEGECIRYVSTSKADAYLGSDRMEEDKMARKLQFDAAITQDMKAAASDSFIDSIKMIEINEIMNNQNNFYEISDIELLADDIEREGLKHNLLVAKDSDTGLYVVKSGHRRLAAIKLLINEKRRKSTKIPCIVDGEKSAAETQFDLIMLNATQRKYTDADKDLGEQLKALGMMVVLENLWDRVVQNRDRGIRTRIYIDEMHLFFDSEQSSDFFLKLYKRARKWGGIPTGITQNVEDLLASDTARRMLSNSEFILMLNQHTNDRDQLAHLLKIPDETMKFVTGASVGSGLIYCGANGSVPFKDDFPTDTKLYKLMTTKFGE